MIAIYSDKAKAEGKVFVPKQVARVAARATRVAARAEQVQLANLMNRKAAAEYFGISLQRMDRLAKPYHLNRTKIGDFVYFEIAQIEMLKNNLTNR
jgi:hypothetical protein